MEAGSYVWCSAPPKSDEAWILAEVLKKKDDELELQQVDKKENLFTRPVDEVDEDTGERKFQGVMLANTQLSNEDRTEGRDNDLITLPHLHEPAILHSISDRFFHGKIYTWTGPVLIAVNPFQRLPLYTDDILDSYRSEGLFRSQGMGDSKSDLDPHVFAVADRSYRQMMSEGRKSQSILISGESGAGKTESTKIVMSYLTTLGGMGTTEEPKKEGELSVMERVLQSNPVLEAFGNARTLRNDNSSRFGKFIELGFNRAGHLLGAKVQTYLLEKVRISFHATGERNYHIFYQLLRGSTDEQKEKYHLTEGNSGGLELPNCFHLTKQGGAPQLREFTDEESFEYTMKAMRALGWKEESIDGVLGCVAGLLHLGETSFVKKETASGQDAAGIADVEALTRCCRLIGVDTELMTQALTQRVVVARGEEITTELTPDRAADARDALAKTIYGALFLWIVDQVNQSICWEKDDEVRSSVGVLDIFGFECFTINSFEQLCINFTNEALQQQFNKFIFKLEQAEYEAEKIEWAFISFPDNQDCLDTIQQKKTGILAMLDDECRLPRGSDRNFAKRMFDQWLPAKDQTTSENTRFSATKVQQGKAIFCVRHFAGIVEYTAETNFMEKNKDEVPLTAHKLLETAPSDLIKEVYAIQNKATDDRAGDAGSGRGATKQKTVGQQFKEQLQDLVASVEKTDPHYIRCLKPNDAAKPSMLTRKRLTEQLRYGGVLEAVRVARAGYPVRLDHKGFFQRYRMLLPTIPDATLPWNMEGQDAQKLCKKLLAECLEEGKRNKGKGTLDPNEDGITRFEKIRRMQYQPHPMSFPETDVQMGLTKVFMRKPPHDGLEAHRVFHQAASVTMIQCWVRGLEKRHNFLVLQDATLTAQRVYRGSVGRKRFTAIRCATAALLVTKHFRMQISRRKFARARKGTIKYQSLFRGIATRRVLAAVKLQRHARMTRRRRNFLRMKSATIALQCKIRVRMAKKDLKGLMGEQKDIGKLKENNDKLKLEMQSLKAMLTAQAKEDASNLEHTQEIEAKQREVEVLEKRVAELEKKLAAQQELVATLEKDLDAQREATAEAATKSLHSPPSPRSPIHIRKRSTGMSPSGQKNMKEIDNATHLQMPNLPSNYISPEVLAKHKRHMGKIEDELKAERKLRREADGEIIKLRAAINGVQLDDQEVDALLAKKLEASSKAVEEGKRSGDTPEITGGEPDSPRKASSLQAALQQSVSDGIASVFGGGEEKKEKEPPRFSLGPVDSLLPSIRRGFTGKEEKDDAMVVGWKADIRSRKEREEILRDNVHRFEGQLQKFLSSLEDGVDVTMWQLNRSEDKDTPPEFPLKSSHVTVKMQRKGDMLVQAVLNFNLKGGYLSKAIGRNRGANKTALEPLSLHDVIEVKAGCSGFEHTDLPSASGRTKSKGKGKNENQKGSLFMTLTATPTPMASSRSYIMKFKSRSSRNDILNGLRSVLADMQINEGVSVSGLLSSPEAKQYDDDDELMVPLEAVHTVLNREREAYDRIMLLLLQGFEDLKEKEDESLGLRKRFDRVTEESAEKDRVQANDSKLIMQLSKKLETLLMDNEDLRDQNDRLNTRLIAAECEKMNMMS